LENDGERIAIVGPGAMGCLFAALLAESGAGVLLADYRPERAEAIAARGVRLESGGETRTVKIDASADPESLRSISGIVFMVKAYSTDAAASRIRDFVPGGAWVMSLQNGMGNTDVLSRHFGGERVLAGTTSEGATLKSRGSVRHAGRGETWIGELDGSRSARAEKFAAALDSAGIKAGVSENVTALLWKKLLINVGINPVTALLRIKNGEILDRESALAVSRTAVREAEAVAASAGVDLGGIDAIELVESVAAKTAENISSMHQDVAAGRRTEIDFISNYIVSEGERLGVATPINRALADLINAISPIK